MVFEAVAKDEGREPVAARIYPGHCEARVSPIADTDPACEQGSDAGNPSCDPDAEGGFKRIVRSQDDAFPSMPPRPVAPDLILRTWPAATTTATHVLFRVLDNQCTGQEAFQGEQDDDQANQTDCRTGSPPLPPRGNDRAPRSCSLQSSKPTVVGAQAVE